MHNVFPEGKSRLKMSKKEALSPQQMRSFKFRNNFGMIYSGSRGMSFTSQLSKGSGSGGKKKYSYDDSSANMSRNLVNIK